MTIDEASAEAKLTNEQEHIKNGEKAEVGLKNQKVFEDEVGPRIRLLINPGTGNKMEVATTITGVLVHQVQINELLHIESKRPYY